MMRLAASLVATEGMFGGFVGREIDSMRRPCVASVPDILVSRPCDEPAPRMTLDKPFHSVRNPSTREMVTMAFDMPEYMAVGEGLTTCIRV